MNTVLFVDDDENLTAGMERVLRKEPYQIYTASSADKALDRLRRTPIDIVISDNVMPGIEGSEFLAQVHRAYPMIISIMLSGQADMGAVIRALNKGQIFRFLVKPCNNDELAAHIRQALAHKSILDRCRRLLPLFRRQANVLQAIERKHPGISRTVEGEVRTTIYVQTSDFINTDSLADNMDVEIQRGEIFFS